MVNLNRNNSNWSFEERRKINENWEILESQSNSVANSNNGIKQDVDKLKGDFSSVTSRSEEALRRSILADYNANYVQTQLDNIVADGDSSAEVVQARGDNDTLRARLDVDYAELNGRILSVGSGAPRGTYSNLAALIAAFPQGTDGIYLTLNDGHWHYYNRQTSAWADGGLYQAQEVADGSVTTQKRTNLGEIAPVICYDNVNYFINFDFENRVIVIPANTSVFSRRSEYNITTVTTLSFDTGARVLSIYFDTATSVFRTITKLQAQTVRETDVLVAIFDQNKTDSVNCNGPFGINGVFLKDIYRTPNDLTVGTSKIIDSSVTTSKRTTLGESSLYVCFDRNNPYINFDFNNSTVTIPANTSIISRRTEYNISVETVLSFSTTYFGFLLYFNVQTRYFKLIDKTQLNQVDENEILIASFTKDNPNSVQSTGPYAINGFQPNVGNVRDGSITSAKRTVLGEPISLICYDSVNSFVNFDFNNRNVIIPANTSVFTKNREYNISTETVLNFDNRTRVLLIYFDTNDSTFRAITRFEFNQLRETEVLVVAFDQNKRDYIPGNLPYGINGISSMSSTLNEIDALRFKNSFDDNIKVAGHRGAILQHPENTFPSFEEAYRSGLAYIEFDVRFTSDNVPVVIHDELINRTARTNTGGQITQNIAIQDITYQEALTYDFGIWRGQQFAGTRIPTLDQVLVLCRNLNIRPYIQLYTVDSRITEVYNIVKRRNLHNKCVWVIDFEGAELILGLNNKSTINVTTTPTNANIDRIASLKTTNTNATLVLDTSFELVNQQVANYLQEKDVEFGLFVGSNNNYALSAVDYGASSLTVDGINVKRILHNRHFN